MFVFPFRIVYLLFDLKEIMFYFKEQNETAFLQRKKLHGKRQWEENELRHAIRYRHRRTQELWDWKQDTPPSASQKYGAGGTWKTHGPFTRAAVQIGARRHASHPRHLASNRDGI